MKFIVILIFPSLLLGQKQPLKNWKHSLFNETYKEKFHVDSIRLETWSLIESKMGINKSSVANPSEEFINSCQGVKSTEKSLGLGFYATNQKGKHVFVYRQGGYSARIVCCLLDSSAAYYGEIPLRSRSDLFNPLNMKILLDTISSHRLSMTDFEKF